MVQFVEHNIPKVELDSATATGTHSITRKVAKCVRAFAASDWKVIEVCVWRGHYFQIPVAIKCVLPVLNYH